MCKTFIVFDYDFLPYLLSLFFCLGVTFPVVALDKIDVEIQSLTALLKNFIIKFIKNF